MIYKTGNWKPMNSIGSELRWRSVAVVLLIVFSINNMLTAQVKIQVAEAEAVPAKLVATKQDDEKDPKKNEEKYAGGAALKTNSDLEDYLKRAKAFVAEKNYRFASTLWDRVLKESDNSLITQDGETYVSLVRQVEETIRSLPPAGLKVYRISADGKARALMTGDAAMAKSESLEKLVRLYFMSSLGDDAAFELGKRALDQRDFVAASRMFTKILTEHPDPSVDRNEVLIRQAIASGNLGDHAAASDSLGMAKVATELKANVSKHLEFIKSSGATTNVAGESVLMRYSGPQRYGLMPDLPADAVSGDLTQGYEYRFPFAFSNDGGNVDMGKIIRGGADPDQKIDPSISALSMKWKTEKWFPANQLLIANNRIVLKSATDLVCIDATTRADRPIWHSLWLNHFELDDASWNAKNYGTNSSQSGGQLPIDLPKDSRESLFFRDKIHHSMATHNGIVFTIEGKNFSQLDDAPPRSRKPTTTRTGFGQPVNLARSRTNYLTAYELKTGKVLWTRPAYEKPEKSSEEADTSTRAGFLGTPVPFGNLVLCPVTEGGSIMVYAMDGKNQGKTVWKTFLCDDPSDGVDLFAPVELTIAGQEAYATCGSGVLFALNAATGNVQFARRYVRDGEKKKYPVSYNQHQEMLLPQGWDDNVVVAWRNALIVLASDHDDLFAIDRRTGEFLWDAPRLPFVQDAEHAYLLGVVNETLYMATNKSVLSYSLAGEGKLQRHRMLTGNSYGRGFITSKAVYIPVEDSIVKLDHNLKVLSQVGVNLGTENKVGNIYSDGKQIWVAGLNRVVGLRSLRDRLDELDVKIKAGDRDSLRERLTIYARLGEFENTLADARQLLEMEPENFSDALNEFFEVLKKTQLNKNAPVPTLAYLNELLLASKEKNTEEILDSNRKLIFETAELAATTDEANTAGLVLGWSAIAPSSGFRSSVSGFLLSHSPDAEALKKVMAEADQNAVLKLIPVAAKLETGEKLLTSLLDSDSPVVVITAASELAKNGSKASLEPALKLLSSTDSAVRIKAYLILKNVTGAEIPFDAMGTDQERKAAVEAWTKWLAENLESLETKSAVQLRFGRIMVASTDRVFEYSIDAPMKKMSSLPDPEAADNSPAKTISIRPEDISCAENGNRVVCEYVRNQIVELDLNGKQVAKVPTKFRPKSVRRLRNGNYLVTWMNSGQPVVELDAKGRVVWTPAKALSGEARSAERLENGNTLIAFSDKILEIDGQSNIVLELARAQGLANCQEARRLPNGNTLVVFGTTVAEYDKDKNQVMRIPGSITPKSAIRLNDGRTVVGHRQGLRIFDKDGKKIDDLLSVPVNAVWEY